MICHTNATVNFFTVEYEFRHYVNDLKRIYDFCSTIIFMSFLARQQCTAAAQNESYTSKTVQLEMNTFCIQISTLTT